MFFQIPFEWTPCTILNKGALCLDILTSSPFSFFLNFCTFSRSRLRHSCSLWRWCISLTFCIKVLSYLIRKEEGESYSVISNPPAPPLQYPRAAPQPPSQPPELSACQAHQVLLLDHLGHDFLNLLVLPRKVQVPMHHTKACAWSLNTRSPSYTPARRCIFPWLPLLKACDSHHLC